MFGDYCIDVGQCCQGGCGVFYYWVCVQIFDVVMGQGDDQVCVQILKLGDVVLCGCDDVDDLCFVVQGGFLVDGLWW